MKNSLVLRLLASFIIAGAALFSTSLFASSSEKVLYNFGSLPDGNYPASNLVLDHSGNLYGTTIEGGEFNSGIVFKLTPSAGQWVESVLYNFCQRTSCTDGSMPYSSLVLDSAGNLYGTTSEGGAYGGGAVFKLTRHAQGGWSETTIHSFGYGADGAEPLAGLTIDKAGNLYGTTSGGGTSTASCFGGCGTVFELTSVSGGSWKETILYNFCSETQCSDGNSLTAGVVLDAAGNLYGTTVYGGTSLINAGTVFELSRGTNGIWKHEVLYAFLGADGENPHAGVIVDRTGNLYGTTAFGGSYGNNGAVFKLIRNSSGQWSERVIYSFCKQFSCSDGSGPYGGLVMDKTGKLYGATPDGGAFQSGVVFELTSSKGTWNEQVLHDFAGGSDGINPHAGLILDAAGNLFGTAYQGGSGAYGIAFEITP